MQPLGHRRDRWTRGVGRLFLLALVLLLACNGDDDTTITETAFFTFSASGTTVTFVDQSDPTPTSWQWDFGGHGASTLRNPTFVFPGAGTFQVELSATFASGNETEAVRAVVLRGDAAVSVVVTPTTVVLGPGEVEEFTAVVSGSADTRVDWSATCGSVTGTGNTITYTAPATTGSCTVTATSLANPARSASAVVTVEAGAILAVTIDQTSLTLDAGDGTTLTATVTTEGSPDTTIHWSSSDTATATITLTEGQLTAHATGTTTITATSAHDPSKQDAITVTVEDRTPGDLLWRRSMGASLAGAPGGVAVDADGNVVLGFSTPGDYWGPSAGDLDVVLGKLDPSGTSLWFRQFGTTALDHVEDVAVDAAGNVVATGYTTGNLGATNPGETSAFVVKHAPDGLFLWSRLFGTEASDRGRAIATDSEGNVFVGGVTAGDLGGPKVNTEDDGFLAKLGPDGDVLWIRQFGDYMTEWVDDVAVGPNDGVALVSSGYRNTGRVRRFDANGNPLWNLSLGIYRGMAGVTFDAAAHVLVTGYGTDAPGFIPDTAFLSRYDDDGVLTWTRWVGPSEGSFARAVAADAFGSAFVLGVTSGDFGELDPPAPAFLAKSDALGSRLWVRQFHPDGRDLAIDASGNAFVTGADDGDIILMKLSR